MEALVLIAVFVAVYCAVVIPGLTALFSQHNKNMDEIWKEHWRDR